MRVVRRRRSAARRARSASWFVLAVDVVRKYRSSAAARSTQPCSNASKCVRLHLSKNSCPRTWASITLASEPDTSHSCTGPAARTRATGGAPTAACPPRGRALWPRSRPAPPATAPSRPATRGRARPFRRRGPRPGLGLDRQGSRWRWRCGGQRDPRHPGAARWRRARVVGPATDDAADRDQRVEALGVGERGERDRHLERSGNGNVHHGLTSTPSAVSSARQLCTSRAVTRLVGTRLHDADAQACAVERQGRCPCPPPACAPSGPQSDTARSRSPRARSRSCSASPRAAEQAHGARRVRAGSARRCRRSAGRAGRAATQPSLDGSRPSAIAAAVSPPLSSTATPRSAGLDRRQRARQRPGVRRAAGVEQVQHRERLVHAHRDLVARRPAALWPAPGAGRRRGRGRCCSRTRPARSRQRPAADALDQRLGVAALLDQRAMVPDLQAVFAREDLEVRQARHHYRRRSSPRRSPPPASARPSRRGRSQPRCDRRASVRRRRRPAAGRCGRLHQVVGLASRATAICTVRARSAAEMPVVTPVAASIETVNAVPCGAPVLSSPSAAAAAARSARGSASGRSGHGRAGP